MTASTPVAADIEGHDAIGVGVLGFHGGLAGRFEPINPLARIRAGGRWSAIGFDVSVMWSPVDDARSDSSQLFGFASSLNVLVVRSQHMRVVARAGGMYALLAVHEREPCAPEEDCTTKPSVGVAHGVAGLEVGASLQIRLFTVGAPIGSRPPPAIVLWFDAAVSRARLYTRDDMITGLVTTHVAGMGVTY